MPPSREPAVRIAPLGLTRPARYLPPPMQSSRTAALASPSPDAAVLQAQRNAWLALSLVSGLGPITLRRAVDSAFGVIGAMRLSHAGWGEVDGIGSHRAAQIIRDLPRAQREAEQILARCDALNAAILTLDDPHYPAAMRDLADAPCVLYTRGTLQPRDLNAVGIVGSRKCSLYGREQAARFASLLAGAGVTVISGGARGVDSAAHEGAMRMPEGRTIAVLGCGVDIAYPPENAELFQQIAAAGAIVSHYPPGTPPQQRHFPERNRVISALSRGILVIEADERSGSLITARIAAEDHGRPVMALPGRIDNPLATGPHNLIRDGATLTTNLEDLLSALGPLPDSAYTPPKHSAAHPLIAPKPPPAEPDAPATLFPATPTQQQILTALQSHQEAAVDTLIEATRLPAATVLSDLTLLTLKGAIKRVDAQTFRIAR